MQPLFWPKMTDSVDSSRTMLYTRSQIMIFDPYFFFFQLKKKTFLFFYQLNYLLFILLYSGYGSWRAFLQAFISIKQLWASMMLTVIWLHLTCCCSLSECYLVGFWPIFDTSLGILWLHPDLWQAVFSYLSPFFKLAFDCEAFCCF